MQQLLSLYREKTRKLNRSDLEQYVLNNIFKKHCTNIDEIINQTQEEQENLFGKVTATGDDCGGREEEDGLSNDDCSDEEDANVSSPSYCTEASYSRCKSIECNEYSSCCYNITDELQKKRKHVFVIRLRRP